MKDSRLFCLYEIIFTQDFFKLCSWCYLKNINYWNCSEILMKQFTLLISLIITKGKRRVRAAIKKKQEEELKWLKISRVCKFFKSHFYACDCALFHSAEFAYKFINFLKTSCLSQQQSLLNKYWNYFLLCNLKVSCSLARSLLLTIQHM